MFSRSFVIGISLVSAFCFSLQVGAYDATYYADSFEWWWTANGSKFSQRYDSAAICTIPLGQYAYVSYWSTGAVVTLNDRPNCSRYPNLVDLSKNAFSYFWNLSQGKLSEVQVTPLIENIGNFPKTNIVSDSFAKLGVKVFTPLSNTYFAGDHILIEGKVLDGKKSLLTFLENKTTGEKTTRLISVDDSWSFSFSFVFPKTAGDYYIILASWNSFSGVLPEKIRLIDPSRFSYPTLSTWSLTFSRPKPEVSISGIPLLRFPTGVWGTLDLQQGKKIDRLQWTTIDLSRTLLNTGSATAILQWYTLSSPSSLDRSQSLGILWTGSILLDYRRESFGREKLILRQTPQNMNFRFRVSSGDLVESKFYVTQPNGDVLEYSFPKNVQTEQWLLNSWIWISGSFSAKQNGSYKLEINKTDGIAYINIPITQGNAWNVVEKFRNNEEKILRSSIQVVEKYILSRVNGIRSSLGRSSLGIDPTLSKIALLKAQDMYDRNYFWHQNPEGQFIGEYARAKGFTITQWLGENIAAGENVSDFSKMDSKNLHDIVRIWSILVGKRWELAMF
jgi:Lytic transglycolase/Cysteine-rich secretory protein family